MIGTNYSKRRAEKKAQLSRASNTAIEMLEVRRMLSTSANFNGSLYTQSFDSLISSGGAITTAKTSGPVDLSAGTYTASGYSGTETRDGWAVYNVAGTGANSIFTPDSGGSTTGSAMSYGNTSDRALGSIASGATISDLGLTLTNTSGSTISSITVTFDGEMWRLGSTTTINTLSFHYQVGGGSLSDALPGVFTAVPALNFSTPTTSGTTGSRDGNNASFRTAGITATISGLNWGNNQTLLLRWDDADDSGSDDGLAIDNVSVAEVGVAAPGTLSFSDVSRKVDESAGTITIPVTRSNGTDGAVDVNYTIGGGGDTATLNSDYTIVGGGTSGTLHFAAGSSTPSNPITLSITDDTTPEPNETISFAITSPTGGATLGTNASSTLVIHDNDSVAPTGLLVNEVVADPPGADTSNEFVELKGASNSLLTDVYLVSLQGNAGATTGNVLNVFDLGTSKVGSNGLVLIQGAQNTTFTPDSGTTVIKDPQLDTTNGIFVNGGADSFVLIYSKNQALTVGEDLDTNNDGTLDLPSGATALDGVGWTNAAGDLAYGAAVSLVTADHPGAVARDPNNSTALSSAAWFGGVLINNPFTGGVTFNTVDSTLNSGDSYPVTAGQVNPSPTLTAGIFAFGHGTYTVTENGVSITIPVYRFGGGLGAVSVDYATADDTATSSGPTPDYVAASGTLNFADGETTKNITIQLVNDSTPELTEDFTVALSNAQGGASVNTATFPPTTAKVNIIDDDVVAPAAGTVLLNEIDVNPPGTGTGAGQTDGPQEFVELKGTPGLILNDVYFASVEGDAVAALGNVTEAINLTGLQFGTNGLILITSPSFDSTHDPAFDPATTIVSNADFTGTSGALQNGSNSFLLIFSTTAITTSTQLDPGHTGTMTLPSGASVVDGIGWTDGINGSFVYGGTTLPLPTGFTGTNVPDAATRFSDNTTPNSVSAWYYGDLGTTTSVNTELNYKAGAVSANFPSGGILTPGNVNIGTTPTDTTPPTVSTSSFNFNPTSPTKQNITVQFSEALQTVTTANLTLSELVGSTFTVPPANMAITQDGTGLVTITFPGYTNGALPDGRYELAVSGVKDTVGNTLATTYKLDFFFQNADADRTGTVGSLDLNAVATNFGKPGTFSQGDFNYSGTVDIGDFNLLAAIFGKVLPASAPPVPLGSLFSASPIAPTTDLEDLLAGE